MTSQQVSARKVYYVPAGIGFVDALAKSVLSGELFSSQTPKIIPPDRLDLVNWTILLPTRRATRSLMRAFVEVGDQQVRLLPNILPLGDVDEDDLLFSDMKFLNQFDQFLPTVTPLEREFMLVTLIIDWAGQNVSVPLAKTLLESEIHCFDLARSLGKMIDRFNTASLDIRIIDDLFDGEFAEHRQQILKFLAIVADLHPAQLAKAGKCAPAQHRNMLMQTYRDFLAQGKASGPVIAAGSTGSIPATAELLGTISQLENGVVVLPGLDVLLDKESWDCLPEHHPQFGMRELLAKIGVDRTEVKILPGLQQSKKNECRNWLASEIMRPAETTDRWRESLNRSENRLATATQNLIVLAGNDKREEALMIALIMRQAVHEKKTAALVSPDRDLARSVKAELARWRIEIDDSAGIALSQTQPAVLLALLIDAANTEFSPQALHNLLSHRYCQFAMPKQTYCDLLPKFEMAILRAEQPFQKITELPEFCERQKVLIDENPHAYPATKAFSDDDWQEIHTFCKAISSGLRPLEEVLSDPARLNFDNIINLHISVAENICSYNDQPNRLWQNEAGRLLADLLARLINLGELAPQMSGEGYASFLKNQMAQTVVRPKAEYRQHLAIYGLLEARLIQSDIMILGGLNETVWPAVSQVDPWLTRPQLTKAGLATPEQKTGLAAHDFSQGFCSDKVYLTYSKKLENSPAVPARWILRLKALLQAANSECAVKPNADQPWEQWAILLDQPETFSPIARPEPKPSLDLRPVNFSVTGVEKLLKNPYRLFAEKILKLAILKPLNKQSDAMTRGILVHEGLENFIAHDNSRLPEQAANLLTTEFDALLEKYVPNDNLKVFWKPQLDRMAVWFVDLEKKLELEKTSSFVEVPGKYKFNVKGTNYLISARADRIDVLTSGSLKIFDYKTGEPPSFSPGAQKFSPQLLLEAVIGTFGQYEGVINSHVETIAYIKLSGGAPAGEVKFAPANLYDQIQDTESGLQTLIAAYADCEQPYRANSEGEAKNAEREYDYLSRWREWAHLFERGE